MHVEELLAELGRRLGLGPLRLDADSACQLVFDDDLAVDIEASKTEACLYLAATICRLPPTDRTALLIRLLEANLPENGGDGSVTAVDDALGEAVLCRRLEPPLTADALEVALATFVDRLAAWRRKLGRDDVKAPDLDILRRSGGPAAIIRG